MDNSLKRTTRPGITGVIGMGFGIAVGLAACTSSSDDTAEVATTDQDIIGGFPATSTKLNAVGAIATKSVNGFTPFCTGTLISPTMVLTAKHCITGHDPGQLAFLVGPNAFAPIGAFDVLGAAVEPTTSGGIIGFGSDVGILHLTTPVGGVAPLAVAPLTNDRLGTRLVSLGYGVQNTDLAHGTRHSGSMTLKATGGSVFAAIFGSFQSFVQNGAARLFPDLDPSDPGQLAALQQAFDQTLLQDGVEAWFGGASGDAQNCTGDGGGPIIAKVGSQTTLFGVSSWGFGDNATCTLDGSAFASINPVSADFIAYETQCPLVPREGTCESPTVALRCANANEGGRRELRTDCGQIDQICGINENGEVGCVDGP